MSVRMRDVAERAGVSTQTVSRALRGGDLVAATTLARVRAAMEELGYHGNEAAGALKRGRTRIFGLLCPLLTMSFWSDVAAGAEAVAHESGHALLVCDTSDSLKKEEDYLSLFLSHRVAGIVYMLPRCRPETHRACASLVRTSIPVVVVSSDPNDLPYCHLRTDDTRAGYVAIRHLLDLGRRRIAIVGSGVYADAAMLPPPAALSDRVAGAGAALREVGISGDRVPILLVPNTLEGGRLAGAALLESGESLPDGIFATTDAVAFGLLEVLRARGLRVPEDTAVVGHDDLFASSLVAPSLTTIAPPRMAMGRACIELLLRAEAGEALPPLAMLEAALMVRESTIGAGPAARRGFSTNLSDPQSWRRWREQMAQTELTAAPPQPVSRLTLDAFLTGKEVIHSDP